MIEPPKSSSREQHLVNSNRARACPNLAHSPSARSAGTLLVLQSSACALGATTCRRLELGQVCLPSKHKCALEAAVVAAVVLETRQGWPSQPAWRPTQFLVVLWACSLRVGQAPCLGGCLAANGDTHPAARPRPAAAAQGLLLRTCQPQRSGQVCTSGMGLARYWPGQAAKQASVGTCSCRSAPLLKSVPACLPASLPPCCYPGLPALQLPCGCVCATAARGGGRLHAACVGGCRDAAAGVGGAAAALDERGIVPGRR